MFGDIGGFELMVIAIVALIVIGPKDLPEMFRQVGRFTAKIRAMAREFSRAMEQAAKESGMSDAARDMKAATSPAAMGLDKVKAAADKFEKWDPMKGAKPQVKPLTPPPMPPAVPTPPAPQAPAAKAKAEPKPKAAAKPKAASATDAPAKTPRKKAEPK